MAVLGAGMNRTSLGELNQGAAVQSNRRQGLERLAQGDRALDQGDQRIQQAEEQLQLSQQREERFQQAFEFQQQEIQNERSRAEEQNRAMADLVMQTIHQSAPKQQRVFGPQQAASLEGAAAGLVTNPENWASGQGLAKPSIYDALQQNLEGIGSDAALKVLPLIQGMQAQQADKRALEAVRGNVRDVLAFSQFGPPTVQDQMIQPGAEALLEAIESGGMSGREAAGTWAEMQMEAHNRAARWESANDWHQKQLDEMGPMVRRDPRLRSLLNSTRSAIESGMDFAKATAEWNRHILGDEAIEYAYNGISRARTFEMSETAARMAAQAMSDPYALQEMVPEAFEGGEFKKGWSLQRIQDRLALGYLSTMLRTFEATQPRAVPRQAPPAPSEPGGETAGPQGPEAQAESGTGQESRNSAEFRTRWESMSPDEQEAVRSAVVDEGRSPLDLGLPREEIPDEVFIEWAKERKAKPKPKMSEETRGRVDQIRGGP